MKLLDKTVWTVCFRDMTQAHHRKKEPARVRQQLLDVAARLSAEHGVGNLTLDAVSQAAGISKGGLLHHFPSKTSLIDGLFDELIAHMDDAISEAMLRDPVSQGRFTRAYVSVVSDLHDDAQARGWRVVTIALLAEPHLRARWRQWVTEKSEAFVGTDSSVDAVLVRFAADGLWLADLIDSHDLDPAQRTALIRRLKELSGR